MADKFNVQFQTLLEMTANELKSNKKSIAEVAEKLTSVFTYKGSVESYADLPTDDLEVGWVYNVETAVTDNNIKAGDNVAWNGEGWDNLSGIFDISGIEAEIQQVVQEAIEEQTEEFNSKFVASITASDFDLTVTKGDGTEETVSIGGDTDYVSLYEGYLADDEEETA